MTAPQKDPPKTVTAKGPLKKSSTTMINIDISYDVIADDVDSKLAGGETEYKAIGPFANNGASQGPLPWLVPNKAGQNMVTKIAQKGDIKFAVRIQTKYKSAGHDKSTSQYGRGTTETDKANGDTSLGFHESCHRDDYKEYFKLTTPPAFMGRIGQTEQQFSEAETQFIAAVKKYIDGGKAYSKAKTDEVGYKLSQYEMDNP